MINIRKACIEDYFSLCSVYDELDSLHLQNHPFIKKRKWVQLDNIAVKSEYQNKKVGNLLVEKVKEWAKEKNINRIELTVYSFNTNTISFYEKKGFNEISKKMYLDF